MDFVPVGSEFLVNTQTGADQSTPSVTGLPNGNFVVAWSANGSSLGDSFYAIDVQLFAANGTKIGAEFQVNTQGNGQQIAPRVTSLIDGGYVVTWMDYLDPVDGSGASVKAQMFTANGTKVGGEVLVNTNTGSDQQYPTVSGLANGGYVVTWQDYSGTLGDSSDSSIKAQLFDATGAKSGGEFLVNVYTNSLQYAPVVAGLANGNFVVTWWDYAGALGDNGSSVTGQLFSASGTKIGGPFPVNSMTAGDQLVPTITALANGGFIVSWIDYGGTQGDADQGSIKAQVFDAFGSKLGGQFLVNTTTVGNQGSPDVVALADGGFVVTWSTTAGGTFGDGTSEVLAQVFSDTGTKIGSEFTVPTNRVDDQYAPTVGALSNGGFVVTWNDDSGTLGDGSLNSIKAQVYGIANHIPGTASDEFLVNTQTASFQGYPQVTGLSNGGYVVTWQDNSGTLGDNSASSIKAQIYSAAGTKVGGEFLVNTQTNDVQQNPNVASLANGGFVVTWDDYPSMTTGITKVKGQIYSASGAKVGGEFGVSSSSDSQFLSDVTTLSNGNFVVTWGNAPGLDIKAQLFSAAGAKIGGELSVNSQTANGQGMSTVAALANGGFVISWQDGFNGSGSGTLGDNNGSSIKAQIYNASGTKVGSEFLVNTHIIGYQTEPQITGLANGRFVVSWTDYANSLGDSDQSITAQIFEANGQKVGGEILINSLVRNSQGQSSITALADGGFAVSWSSYINESQNTDIKAQLFSASGTRVGEEFLVNVQTSDAQVRSSITTLANGDLVISWMDASGTLGDSAPFSIKARTISFTNTITGTDGPNTLHGTASADHILGLNGDDQLYGEGGNDRLEGGAGNDRIDGGTGVDTMFGGQGDDRFYVDNAADVVVEYAGQGTDSVYASVSYSIAGQQIEKLYLTGTANINASGSGAANMLVGNSGNNILNGYGGADVMQGGAGDDSYYVDNAGDTIIEQANEGIDRVFSTISYSLAGTYVEKLNLTGTANIDATGSGQDNTLVGNSGNNVLNGLSGADQMQGGAGNDTYYVDNIGDKIIEQANEGIDTVLSTISFSIAGLQVENLTLRGTEALNGTGNSLANILIGNNGNNTLNGLTGNDELRGGKGSDVLIGGAGQDKFVFDTAIGSDIDTLADFTAVDDQIGLARSIFTALAPGGTLSADAFRIGPAALDANDRIIYDADAGRLYYDADGNGAGAAIKFARMDVGTVLTAADFYII